MGKLDFKGLNEYALSNIDSVLHHYLPNGKHEGHEYKPLNPRRADNKSDVVNQIHTTQLSRFS